MSSLAQSLPRSCAPAQDRDGIRGFFMGAGLPLFLIAAVAVYELFLVAVVLAPTGLGQWSNFSQEFKIWCFRYDVRTGGMEWAAFWVMLAEPMFVVGTAVFLWRARLGEAWAGQAWRKARGPVLAGAVVGASVVTGLFAYGRPGAEAEALLPFPGERIRTALTPPEFRFVDQTGAPLALGDLKGRVVLVTGVYAMCSTSCPDILRELKAVMDGVPADVQERLSVVAVSLNPEYDTADLMGRVAEAYGLPYPQFRYLNGEPTRVLESLTQLGFARVRNAETGVIDHANLFLVLDSGGKIAYRFNLDPRHKAWLKEAVVSLAREARP